VDGLPDAVRLAKYGLASSGKADIALVSCNAQSVTELAISCRQENTVYIRSRGADASGWAGGCIRPCQV